jgi:signal transduction histidine kinase/DNA-binding response OmpR family regulator
MSAPTILVVEDNPITRKMFRVVIEGAGFVAVEAGTGGEALEQMESRSIQLVLMDMVLPDMSGFELARRLRELPGGTETPVVALSGFGHLLENARQRPETFDAFLFKPVESERLIETIRGYLPGDGPSTDVSDGLREEHVLIVDDDPVQLKLSRLNLATRFTRISTAGGGAAALSQARSAPPDLILSDVLMPGMDGFELTMAMRQDPQLAAIPIVLVSAHYADTADDELARRVGASALLPRKADFEQIIATIIEILDRRTGTAGPILGQPSEHLHRDHIHRARLQLERQVALAFGQAQRTALQSAQLSILSRVANALTRCTDVDAELGDVLAACLDAAGVNRGVLYQRMGEGSAPRVSHAVGFADQDRRALENVFGHARLLEQALGGSMVLPVAAPPLKPEEATGFLASAGVASAFFVPLVGGGRCVGVLMLGSSIPTPEQVQVTFCEALGAYIGQALVLADAFARERSAREAAEEASRAKSNFLSMVSHELLTPLTSIRLQLERLQRPGGEPIGERQIEIIRSLSRGEDRLRGLVTGLLEYARIESGRLEVVPELVDVTAILRELVNDLQPRAQRKQIALQITTPSPPVGIEFRTDQRLFRLIASNLIDNAIKFTDAGRVEASLVREGPRLKLMVADTGRGIPPEEHSRIFEPFEQLEKVRNKHTPGVGLGLALVKRLVGALGGTVEISSRVGAGSQFTATMGEMDLPVAVDLAAPFGALPG